MGIILSLAFQTKLPPSPPPTTRTTSQFRSELPTSHIPDTTVEKNPKVQSLPQTNKPLPQSQCPAPTTPCLSHPLPPRLATSPLTRASCTTTPSARWKLRAPSPPSVPRPRQQAVAAARAPPAVAAQ